MIPVPYSEKFHVFGPECDTEVVVTVTFTWPPAALPASMDRVLEQELRNAIARIMERAKKARK